MTYMEKLGDTQLDGGRNPYWTDRLDSQYSITLVWVHYDQNGLIN